MGRGTKQGLHFRLVSRAFAVQNLAHPGRQALCRLLRLLQFGAQLHALGGKQANVIAVLTVRADEVLRLAGVAHFGLGLQGKRPLAVVTDGLFHGLILARPGAKNYA